ncbi:hypothetical protein TWF703_007979 [Orbilia oligospora]|uniref:Uncharacterized protein n=1 Tax=Orbilia oligospora TaxID=2813651 RepID=A0A7C8JXH5_ORBOL|nr:hypothetical protein TWF703_007979 [Orbilia oligospora]
MTKVAYVKSSLPLAQPISHIQFSVVLLISVLFSFETRSTDEPTEVTPSAYNPSTFQISVYIINLTFNISENMSYSRALSFLEQASELVPYLKNGQFFFLLLIILGYFTVVSPQVASAIGHIFILALSMARLASGALLMFSPPLIVTHMYFKYPETYMALISATVFFVGKVLTILGGHFHGIFTQWVEGHPGLQDFLDQVSTRGLGHWIQDLAVRIAEPAHTSNPTMSVPPSPNTTIDHMVPGSEEPSDLNSDGSSGLGTGSYGAGLSDSDGAEESGSSGVPDSPIASSESSPGETSLVTVPRYNLHSPVQGWYSRGGRFHDPETPCPKRDPKTPTSGVETPMTPLVQVRSQRFPTPPRQESSVVPEYASGNVRAPPGFEGVVPGTPFWAKF